MQPWMVDLCANSLRSVIGSASMSARRPIAPQAAAAAHHADHAGAADAAVGLDAERLKVARDQLGGAVLLEGELGVGVDVAADRGQLALQGADAFDEAHGCTVLLWFVAGVRV